MTEKPSALALASIARRSWRGESDGGLGVGVPGVPAGHLRVVVELVARVPAEDHVAEAEATLGHAPELVQRDVLAAQDAVDVESAQLDLLHLRFGELGAQRLDLRCARRPGDLDVHAAPSHRRLGARLEARRWGVKRGSARLGGYCAPGGGEGCDPPECE